MPNINLYQHQIARSLDGAKQNLEAATRRLQEDNSELATAKIAYVLMPKGLSKVTCWLLKPVAGAAEMPGAWVVVAAIGFHGWAAWATTFLLAGAGVYIGSWLGRTSVAARDAYPGSAESKDHAAAIALTAGYLITILWLRLNFAFVVLGLQGFGSMIMLMIISAVGLVVAYECAAKSESDEAAHLRWTIRQLQSAVTRGKNRYEVALRQMQCASAEFDRHRQSASPHHTNGVAGPGVAAAIALCMLLSPASAHAQTADRAGYALRACEGTAAMPILGHSQIAMAVLSGSDIPTSRREVYEGLAEHVIAVACAAGATLSIWAINSDSFTQEAAFVGRVPSSDDNPMILAESRNRFVNQAVASVDALYSIRSRGPSDVTAAIRVAARYLVSGTGPNYLFVIGHGWPETPVNLFRSGEDPRRRMSQLIDRVRSSGGLDLRNVNVYFIGVAAGPKMNATDEQLFELCDSWKSFVTASHGKLAYCGAGFPGTFSSALHHDWR